MKNISGSVSVNDFVKRQVKGSGKTYADSLTFEEIALALSECLSLEVLSSDWKTSISEVATVEAVETPDLLRAFVRTFPSGASAVPATALIAAYLPRIDSVVSGGISN